jgi:hypothetical protein
MTSWRCDSISHLHGSLKRRPPLAAYRFRRHGPIETTEDDTLLAKARCHVVEKARELAEHQGFVVSIERLKKLEQLRNLGGLDDGRMIVGLDVFRRIRRQRKEAGEGDGVPTHGALLLEFNDRLDARKAVCKIVRQPAPGTPPAGTYGGGHNR